MCMILKNKNDHSGGYWNICKNSRIISFGMLKNLKKALEKTTIFNVQHPLQSATPPSSKYHTTLFKVPHPLQISLFSFTIQTNWTKSFNVVLKLYSANFQLVILPRNISLIEMYFVLVECLMYVTSYN